MPRDGRYVTKSQGWRCDECPGMGGMSQCAMINLDASLCHHLFDIPIAKDICTIPSYTLKNNFPREVSRFKTDHMELLEVKLSFNIILERPECDKTAA